MAIQRKITLSGTWEGFAKKVGFEETLNDGYGKVTAYKGEIKKTILFTRYSGINCTFLKQDFGMQSSN